MAVEQEEDFKTANHEGHEEKLKNKKNQTTGENALHALKCQNGTGRSQEKEGNGICDIRSGMWAGKVL